MSGMSTGGVVAPGSGRRVLVGPNELRVKAGPEQGHTLLGLFEVVIPPGGGFPFGHVHDEYEEVFYVLDGEVEYRLGDAWTAASAGSTVCVPRGVVHAFRNTGQRPARHLVAHAPAAALEMIEELEQARGDQADAVLARHRSRMVDG